MTPETEEKTKQWLDRIIKGEFYLVAMILLIRGALNHSIVVVIAGLILLHIIRRVEFSD